MPAELNACNKHSYPPPSLESINQFHSLAIVLRNVRVKGFRQSPVNLCEHCLFFIAVGTLYICKVPTIVVAITTGAAFSLTLSLLLASSIPLLTLLKCVDKLLQNLGQTKIIHRLRTCLGDSPVPSCIRANNMKL